MGKKKQGYGPVEPYAVNPKISVIYHLLYGKDTITPGDKIRIRNMRGTFTFVRLAHNEELDSTWIDCTDSTGAMRSFHVAKLKSVVRPKRSYRKRKAAA